MHIHASPPFRPLSNVRCGVCCCVFVGLLGMAVSHADAQPLHLSEAHRDRNTPGLRCWGIRGGMASKIVVYSRPVAGAPALGHTVSMVAATGRPMSGYLPVLTSVGVNGWVRLAEVERDRWTGQPCVVRREANGNLTFSYGQGVAP